MSMEALRWAFPLVLTGAKKAVLLALAEHADADGKCWPSIPRIALFAGVSARAAQVAVRQLAMLGILQWDCSSGGRGHSSDYHLNIGCEIGTPPSSGGKTVQPVHPNGYVNGAAGSGLKPSKVQPVHPLNGAGESPIKPERVQEIRERVNQLHPNPKEPPIKKERVPPITPQGGRVSDAPDFEIFWQRYPRKDSKGHARRAWAGAVRKTDAATIIAGLAVYPFNSNPRFHPMPSTWLNGERWLPVETVVKRGAWDWLDDMLHPQANDPNTIDGEVDHGHYAVSATH